MCKYILQRSLTKLLITTPVASGLAVLDQARKLLPAQLHSQVARGFHRGWSILTLFERGVILNSGTEFQFGTMPTPALGVFKFLITKCLYIFFSLLWISSYYCFIYIYALVSPTRIKRTQPEIKTPKYWCLSVGVYMQARSLSTHCRLWRLSAQSDEVWRIVWFILQKSHRAWFSCLNMCLLTFKIVLR